MKRKRRNTIDLLRELIRTNFKLQYSDSILGVIWVVMKPLLNFLILFFVFSAFRGGFKSPDFAARLLIGLIVYGFIQEGVVQGMGSLLKLQNVILKVDFPRHLAVFSAVVTSMVNFFINLGIILLLTLFVSFIPSLVGSVYFIAIMVVLFFLVYGISLILSILVIKVRDLQNIVQVLFQLLFWASAIFYDIDSLDGAAGQFVRLNPIAIIIDASRGALIEGEFWHREVFVLFLLAAVIIYFTGRLFFSKYVRKVAEFI